MFTIAIINGAALGAIIALVAFCYSLNRTKEAVHSIWVALAGFIQTVLMVWLFQYTLVTADHVEGYLVTSVAFSVGLIAAGEVRKAHSEDGLFTVIGTTIILLSSIGVVAYFPISVGAEVEDLGTPRL